MALVTKRSKTESGSKIQVLTKHQRTKKEPTGDELEEGEIQTNQRPDQSVHFETIVKGNDFKLLFTGNNFDFVFEMSKKI